MHELVGPDERAAARIEGDQGIRVAVIAAPLAAVVVRRRAGSRHEQQVALRIGRHHRPHIGRARAAAAVAEPIGLGRPRVLGNGIEGPALFPAEGVVAVDHAARRVRANVIENHGAHGDRVVDDRGRRGGFHLAEVLRRRRGLQAHHAALAEPGARQAAARVDGEQAHIHRGVDHPRGAQGIGIAAGAAPLRDAAADILIG